MSCKKSTWVVSGHSQRHLYPNNQPGDFQADVPLDGRLFVSLKNVYVPTKQWKGVMVVALDNAIDNVIYTGEGRFCNGLGSVVFANMRQPCPDGLEPSIYHAIEGRTLHFKLLNGQGDPIKNELLLAKSKKSPPKQEGDPIQEDGDAPPPPKQEGDPMNEDESAVKTKKSDALPKNWPILVLGLGNVDY